MNNAFDSLEARTFFSAGAADTSFGGGDGSVDVVTSVSRRAAAQVDYSVDDRGRTVIGSFYRTAGVITLARLQADGSVDKTFGVDGIATLGTGFEKRSNGTFQVTTDHAGKVLVLFKNRVMRVNESGHTDRLFGTKGALSMPMFFDVGDLTVDARNRPIVVGTSAGQTGTRATVVRFGIRGAIDPSFGSSGIYKTPVPTYKTSATAGNAEGVTLKVLNDGNIVGVAHFTARRSSTDAQNGENGVISFRLAATGILDTDYGKSGFARQSSFYSEVTGAGSSFETFAADGSVVVGNYAQDSGEVSSRRKTWSKIDGDGAITTLPFEGLVDNPDRDDDTTIFPTYDTSVVAVESDGKFLVRYSDSFVRFTTKAKRDTSFPELSIAHSKSLVADGDRALIFSTIYVGFEPQMSVVRVKAIEL